jgi:hypothetical protein
MENGEAGMLKCGRCAIDAILNTASGKRCDPRVQHKFRINRVWNA